MPNIEFTTKGAEKVVAAHDKLDNATKKQQRNYQITAKEAQNLARIETRLIRDTETARERYVRKLNEARKALAGNAREAEILQRVETKLKLEYAKSVDANKKLLEQRKQAARDAAAEQKRLTGAVQETQAKTKGIGATLKSIFSPTNFAAYAGGFLSIHKAIALISEELRSQQAMIDKRAATQLTVGESRNVVLRNLVGASPETIKTVQQSATSIASGTGVSEVAINNALASAISATGGNTDLAIDLVRQATKFLKDRPSEIGDFAGSLGDLTRVTGSTDPSVSLGLLSKVGQLSRITSPRLLAANAAPALIGTSSFGGDARTGAALFAALTTGSGDFTGAISGTGAISLAEQLETASLGKGTFAQKGFNAGDIGGNTLLDRIRFLQNNPALATKFIDSASFEKKVKGPIRDLLTEPQSQIAQEFSAGLAAIGDDESLATLGRDAIGMFDRFNRLEPVAGVNRAISRAAEQIQTSRVTEHLSSDALDKLSVSLKEAGESEIGKRFRELSDRLDDGKVSLTEVIEDLREAHEHFTRDPTMKAVATGTGGVSAPFWDAPTPEQRAIAPVFQQLINELKEQQRIMREQAAKQDEANQHLGDLSTRDGGMLAGSE